MAVKVPDTLVTATSFHFFFIELNLVATLQPRQLLCSLRLVRRCARCGPGHL